MDLISTDPCTGAEVWCGPAATIGDIDRAVTLARAILPEWEGQLLRRRVEVLRSYAAIVEANARPLAECIARETGKPLWEAETEAASVAAKVEISIRAHDERAGHRCVRNGDLTEELSHRAHGVLAVLGPFNFPAHLPNGHIVPALLAGNAVLFKPSELAPATGEMMATFWHRAGLPDGVLQVVQGAGETGRALAAHPGLDGLLFTGSAATGRALARRFADAPGRILALEMGGNNPLVLWNVPDDAMPGAAALVAQSAFLTAGQRCSCARRLILDDRLADRFLPALQSLTDDLIVGAPFDDPQPFMGPVIDIHAASRIERQFEALRHAGGRVVMPLERLLPDRSWLSPAIIDTTAADSAPDEEIFGPVLQVFRVSHFEEAVARANATRYGLSAGLIGGDETLFERFRHSARAGVVNWNRPTTGASSALPFGGIGDSGNDRPSAYYAADYCAYPVATLQKPTIEGKIAVGIRGKP
jgi:succinylglutamic semialdehyde dehydrogenase